MLKENEHGIPMSDYKYIISALYFFTYLIEYKQNNNKKTKLVDI